MSIHDRCADRIGQRVCVIGAGAIGLVAVKNLKEQGLQVTAFERNLYVGGNWHVSNDTTQVSALPQTRLMSSKYWTAFTDFPMAEDYPTFPAAEHVQSYLEAYAHQFQLLQHIKLGMRVVSVRRDADDSQWLVHVENLQSYQKDTQAFDRVVIATGTFNTKRQPIISGIEKFAGDILHAREFKNPSQFANKDVLVVGAGPTGADTLCQLKNAGAKKLYFSHRSRFYVIPSTIHGYSWDRSSHTTRPSYGPLHHLFLVSDEIPCLFKDEEIQDEHGIREVTGPHSVTFTDGRQAHDIDAIIFCTGYLYDDSLIQGIGSPTDPNLAPDGYKRYREARFSSQYECFPRLYHGILSESYPESLAVLGHYITLQPTFTTYDLATMAIASLWSGSYPIPSRKVMKREIGRRYSFVVRILEKGPMPTLGFRLDSKESYEWMNRAAELAGMLAAI
ncbi:hypothetical protein NLG97_g2733 [Lecanicillium saksenae]|uniref:Uncharacterized protein n=1 Tax=Lecanicillium saksenae TaxID=468837 RepID=A0ACC1R3G3_9HYPO|nr:hypothetical protein NLG97_g2733 [Lecanicillium saksenae]